MKGVDYFGFLSAYPLVSVRLQSSSEGIAVRDEPRRRATFTGYYGMNNFGDDLFGIVCSAAARRYWDSDSKIVGPPIRGCAASCTMPSWYPTSIYGATGALGKASRLYSFARGLSGSDVFVMGGGSVIGGAARSSFRERMMRSAHAAGRVKLAAVGVSIDPAANAEAEDAVANFLAHFDYIAVRDKRSYELAAKLGVAERAHLGRDLAGLLPLVAAVSPDASGAAQRRSGEFIRVGVAPCNYGVTKYGAPDKKKVLAALVGELVRLAASRPLQVDIFSLNDHLVYGDYELAAALEKSLLERGVTTQMQRYRGRSPLSIVDAIGECDAFISVRLHGAIVAYLQGIPFAIVDYHPKCNDFADEVGLPSVLRIRAGEDDISAVIGGALSALLNPGNEPALSRATYCEQAEEIFKLAPWLVNPRSDTTSDRTADPVVSEA